MAGSFRHALSKHPRGSTIGRTKGQEFALKVFAAAPDLSQREISVLLGLKEDSIRKWLARYEDFRRDWDRVAGMAKGGGPPPVPGFEQWRAEYVNVTEENPTTLRKMNVGVTFPYMRPLVDNLGKGRRICCIWPVRHAKTKILEQYVVYRLCQNPNLRVLYFAGSESLAKDRVYAIQLMLTDDRIFPDLHKTWGRWIGKPVSGPRRWSSVSFYVGGRDSTERDPSVRAMGIKTNALGPRADVIILDDVDTPDNSDEDRRKILRKINTTIRTRLNEGGEVIYIGNRCGVNDVPSYLMTRQNWIVDVQSAINEDGTALCPEMYSIEDLNELAQDMTHEEFAMMLLNDPTPEGSMLFPPDLVNAAKRPVDQAPQEWERIVAMDPAKTETSSILALAVDRSTGIMRVVDVESRKNARHDGKMELLLTFLARHKPSTVIIEDQGGSDSFADVPSVRAAILEAGARLVKFHTGKNKHDPGRGMPLVATKLATEKLTICWGDPLTDDRGARVQARMKPLVDALIAYKPKAKSHHGWHWDEAMCLWFAVSWLEEQGPRHRVGTRVADPLVAKRPWLRAKIPAKMPSPAAFVGPGTR